MNIDHESASFARGQLSVALKPSRQLIAENMEQGAFITRFHSIL